MRVITGLARGKRLLTLEGESVRPTADRVKEAIFSMIQFDIEGRNFLDLFAGSGQMGIEALSRGAKLAVFIDKTEESVQIIKKNLISAGAGLSERARVLRSDFAAYLAHTGDKFDFAFLDPPYNAGILDNALLAVAPVMNTHGVILCEHTSGKEMPQRAGDFLLAKQYRYGKIIVSSYRKEGVSV